MFELYLLIVAALCWLIPYFRFKKQNGGIPFFFKNFKVSYLIAATIISCSYLMAAVWCQEVFCDELFVQRGIRAASVVLMVWAFVLSLKKKQ